MIQKKLSHLKLALNQFFLYIHGREVVQNRTSIQNFSLISIHTFSLPTESLWGSWGCWIWFNEIPLLSQNWHGCLVLQKSWFRMALEETLWQYGEEERKCNGWRWGFTLAADADIFAGTFSLFFLQILDGLFF